MAPDKVIVISTHILEEVDAVCTRAIIIASGRIVADEKPATLIPARATTTRSRSGSSAGGPGRGRRRPAGHSRRAEAEVDEHESR